MANANSLHCTVWNTCSFLVPPWKIHLQGLHRTLFTAPVEKILWVRPTSEVGVSRQKETLDVGLISYVTSVDRDAVPEASSDTCQDRATARHPNAVPGSGSGSLAPRMLTPANLPLRIQGLPTSFTVGCQPKTSWTKQGRLQGVWESRPGTPKKLLKLTAPPRTGLVPTPNTGFPCKPHTEQSTTCLSKYLPPPKPGNLAPQKGTLNTIRFSRER